MGFAGASEAMMNVRPVGVGVFGRADRHGPGTDLVPGLEEGQASRGRLDLDDVRARGGLGLASRPSRPIRSRRSDGSAGERAPTPACSRPPAPRWAHLVLCRQDRHLPVHPGVADTGSDAVGCKTVPSPATSGLGVPRDVLQRGERGRLRQLPRGSAGRSVGGGLWTDSFPPQPVTSNAMVAAVAAPTAKLREPPGAYDGVVRAGRARVERLLTKTPRDRDVRKVLSARDLRAGGSRRRVT